jgi:hypothetical protein
MLQKRRGRDDELCELCEQLTVRDVEVSRDGQYIIIMRTEPPTIEKRRGRREGGDDSEK